MSLAQLKVMSAIETCRTAALGGHVERCEDCAHERVAYNSCRNRHCPKCQAAAARQWLAEREAELLPVPYYHVVFTLPAAIGAIAFQNKAAVYDLLFRAAAETLITIAADPEASGRAHRPHRRAAHLGLGADPSSARPRHRSRRRPVAGRVALDRLQARLLPARARALAPVPPPLPRRPRGAACRPAASPSSAISRPLADKRAFDAALAPLRRSEWVVYAKRPFAGPQAVLAYLARYTHRVAISNSRLIALDETGVTFKWKDYRIKGRDRLKTMTLDAAEFIRRFLLHVLPSGFHRIRHYGLFASPGRARNISRLCELIAAYHGTVQPSRDVGAGDKATDPEPSKAQASSKVCPCCGGRMRIVETFARGAHPHSFTAEPAGVNSA